jgi:serine/threonine-protein kinase RsbW
VRPTPVTRGPSKRDREFSVETMGELLRALRARAADYPESPGLIASWPGVPADRMSVACAELQRQGHPVHQVDIVGVRNKVRRGWMVDYTNGHQAAPSGPPALGAEQLTVLVREVAEPQAVPLARAVVTQVAEREGAPDTVRSALALAVSEACTNVVLHAYADADAPGDLEVRARKAGSVLTVEVADDGRGLVPRIDSPGLGLGLPLIAQVVDVLELRTERARPGLVVRMQFDLEPNSETSP